MPSRDFVEPNFIFDCFHRNFRSIFQMEIAPNDNTYISRKVTPFQLENYLNYIHSKLNAMKGKCSFHIICALVNVLPNTLICQLFHRFILTWFMLTGRLKENHGWVQLSFFFKKKSLIKLNNYHISSVRESSIRLVQIATSSGENASSHWMP